MTEEDRILLAQTINEANLGWTATSQIGATAFAQTKASSKTFQDGTDEWDTALGKAQQFLDEDFDEISIEDLPEEWDWTDVDGYDFVGQAYD